MLDYVTNTILPALEARDQTEAMRNYAGTYTSTDPNLNDSITIGLIPSTPTNVKSDLVVLKWSYNGTDVIAGPFFDGDVPRLQQSTPKQGDTGSPGQVAFQLSKILQTTTYMDAMKFPDLKVTGPWTGFFKSNGDFLFTDQQRLGGVDSRLFVFDVEVQGKATACTRAGDRVTLKRTA